MRPRSTAHAQTKFLDTPRGLTRLICALTATLSLNGCSFLFTEGPREGRVPDPRGAESCTTSYAAPVVDSAPAGLDVAGTADMATRSDEELQQRDTSRGAAVAGGFVMVGGLGTSSVVGFTRVSDCRASLEPSTSRYVSRRPPPAMRRTPSGVKPIE